MMWTSWVLAAALTAGPPLAQQPDRASLSGRVLSEDGRAPIPYARVEALDGSRTHAAVADAEGRYLLKGLPAGRHVLLARALGHAALEVAVHVPESGALFVDLTLPVAPVAVPGLRVISAQLADSLTAAMTVRGSPADPELRALEASPGAAELGLVEAPRAGPDPLDPSSVLYVRGAASDLKLVLLDGAPVYAPFHLGGLLQAFQPDILRSAKMYVGGAPARYDGGLSYVLDLRTRSPRRDRAATSGTLDLLGAGAVFDAPAGPLALLVSGRTLHRAGADPLAGEPLPYEYADGLARLDLVLGNAQTLSATAFFNRESVRLDPAGDIDPRANWGNTAGTIRYRATVGDRRAEVTAAFGEFTNRLPIGDDGAANGRSRRARITADILHETSAQLALDYGAAYERHRIDVVSAEPTDSGTLFRARRGDADRAGAYADARWTPARDWEVRAGLRANLLVPAGEVRLAPRASARWRASEHSSLSIAVGRHHQYVRTSETILSGSLADGLATFLDDEAPRLSSAESILTDPAPVPLAVGGATHLVVGLDHLPRENLRLGLEAFFKAFDGDPALADLRAAGADLWVDWRGDARSVWVGYSLAWVWTEAPPAGYSERFSGRQMLSGGVQLPLPSGLRLDLQLTHHSGLPFASIPVADAVATRDGIVQHSGTFSEELTGAPPGSYFQIDGKVYRTWTTRWLGTEMRITPYLKVLNALDRRDAIFYQFNAERDLRPRSLGAVPLLPIVGIEWGG